MANFGRFVCVLVPFLLTLASLVAMLVAGLSGIADKSLYMFRVNVTDLQLSADTVTSIIAGSGINLPSINIPGVGRRQAAKTSNITAADLGLNDIYDVNVWNYCYTAQNGTRECTKPKFDWAATALNTTTDSFNNMLTSTGLNVTLPKEITSAVKSFGTVSKWTQIVFIIAYVALGVELFFGLFANCSRAFSCVTFLVAGIATVAVGAAAGLATATSVVVVGAVEASAKVYGVDAHFNTRFLATVWLGVAFALAAGLFWMFTICCCAPDHGSRHGGRSRHADAEKYQRLGGEHGGAGAGYAQQYPRQSYAQPQHSGAYEPYSHARV